MSIISVSCSKFTNRSLTLLLSTTLASLLDPISRALTYYVRFKSYPQFLTSFACISCCGITLITLSLYPDNSVVYSGSFDFLPVTLYIISVMLYEFTNTSMFLFLRDALPASQITHAYRWNGMFNQLGNASGAIVIFIAIILGAL